jgi:glycosyltransferase involved in cell wall biosynthesis
MVQSTGALPSLSLIVLPSHDEGWARLALDSIVAQNYPRLQVVCFARSTASPAPCALVLPYRDHQGPGEGLEQAVRACSGELVGWLSEGDCCWRDSLWTVGRAAAAHPGFGLYVGNGLWQGPGSDSLRPFNPRHLALNRRALQAGADYLCQPAVFVRRTAWEEAGGADPALRHAVDWDLLRRVAARHPAVLINEFLAVRASPESDEPRLETLWRALEIARLAPPVPGKGLPASHCHALVAGLTDATRSTPLNVLALHLDEVVKVLHRGRGELVGHADGFPVEGDAQDVTYLPFVCPGTPRRPELSADDSWPSFSIVTPSFNQARFLPETIDSILGQGYPHLESIVIDGGSSDGSREVLEGYDDRLGFWSSKPDRGPADAINQGLARATGEVVSWLGSDDVLAADAVWEAARLFRDDPELDLVYGNALYIDENSKLFLADHGHQRTGLYHGAMQPVDKVPAYWKYIHAVPQPTVFFRRRLLERCGMLDESYKFIFDFELFWRFAQQAKVVKLERTQAFYRIHTHSKTSDWNRFLVELYRFSRPLWPGRCSKGFPRWLRGYVASVLGRWHGGRPRNVRYWVKAGLVTLSALTGVGNPETFPKQRKVEPPDSPVLSLPALPEQFIHPDYNVDRAKVKYRSIFCGLTWPRHPGHSGGEIRDFHLLRRLLSLSQVTFYGLYAGFAAGRDDLLGDHLEALHSGESIAQARPRLVDPGVYAVPLYRRLLTRLQKAGLPIPGARYHLDARAFLVGMHCHIRAALQEEIERRPPDFLFVSPQVNPIGMLLKSINPRTRLILASYDVESVRIRRLAESRTGWLTRAAGRMEAARAQVFEQDNLSIFDGVIAVSELDRDLFVNLYGYPAERVLVVPNGVDPEYFCFLDRPREGPRAVMFTGSLGYLPNHQAALRLIDQIMPRVRQHHPDAVVWIVGQAPTLEVRARHDGKQTIVTGQVDDVRPYLAGATCACVPLLAGSGTKYKVLEALSSGLPVACSPLAAEGLDLNHGEHLLVGETDEELAAALVRLLEDGELASRLARAGRRKIERVYSWEHNLSVLSGWMATLARLPRYTEAPAGETSAARAA